MGERAVSTDGVEVAVHDLGGDGPPLLLAHAAGLCGGVFGPLASRLGGRFRCWALDFRGHGDSITPEEVDFAWSGLADDALAGLDHLGLEGAYGVGHSSGGAALLDAEARRPGTFSALWCFEAIVWPEPPPLAPRMALIEGALRRRETFPSRSDAYAHFAAKPPLAALDPDALRAYVECGFADDDAGDGSVRLKCRREAEAAVYRQGLTHDGFARLGDVTCDAVVAVGANSPAIGLDVARAQAAALPRGRLEVFDGLGHFGPLEDPDAVAGAVLRAFGAGAV
ncbi:MAG: alpha/beta hydrolase [Actinomycetota bacterium]|nr:alpha/beta hydrolase [Actinomycetota bacterium]